MLKKRFERLDTDKQASIFKNAALEFTQYEYEHASLNRILQKSGIGKSMMYYYFEDKADLFEACLMHFVFKSHSAQATTDSNDQDGEQNQPSIWKILEADAIHTLNLLENEPLTFRLKTEMLRLFTTKYAEKIIPNLWTQMEAMHIEMIRQGQSTGEIRNDLPASLLVDELIGISYIYSRWMMEQEGLKNKQEKKNFINYYIALGKGILQPSEQGNK